MIEGRMRGTEMPQQPEQFQEFDSLRRECGRALRLLCVLALGTMLAACGRCGDFLGSSQSQIGACHSDSPSR